MKIKEFAPKCDCCRPDEAHVRGLDVKALPPLIRSAQYVFLSIDVWEHCTRSISVPKATALKLVQESNPPSYQGARSNVSALFSGREHCVFIGR
jgi:hypothetical protein